MKQIHAVILTICASAILTSCATQEPLSLPVRLSKAQATTSTGFNWLDERPLSDRTKSEVPTAIGFLVTLGDDISDPTTIAYLRNRLQVEGSRSLANRTVKVKRFKVTAESRDSWAAVGFRPPSSVSIAQWEMKQMPIENRSKVEVLVLLEIDGRFVEAKSAVPFERQPSSLDISNAIKVAVDNVLRSIPQ